MLRQGAATRLALAFPDKHGSPSSALGGISVDPIESLDVLRFPIARLPFSSLLSLSARQPLPVSRASSEAAPAPRREEIPTVRPSPCRPLHHRFLLFGLRFASLRQREGLGFYFHERSTERADAGIEIARSETLQVAEETPDPRRHVLLEDLAVGAWLEPRLRRWPVRHDLAKDRRVILRLRLSFGRLDAQPLEVRAKRESGRSYRKPVR